MNILLKHNLSFSVVAAITAAAMAMSTGCKGKGDLTASASATPPAVVVADIAQRTVPIYSEFVGRQKPMLQLNCGLASRACSRRSTLRKDRR